MPVHAFRRTGRSASVLLHQTRQDPLLPDVVCGPCDSDESPTETATVACVEDVERSTTVAELLKLLSKQLRANAATTSASLHLHMYIDNTANQEADVRHLDPAATVEEVDLFNNLGRVVISTLGGPESYRKARSRVDEGAHNPTPRAPEHLGMLNNLASQRAKPGAGTHLPRHRKTWRKLATHAQHVAASPTHCCFQCGMLNYPKEGDEIVVSNITNRRDCRAYRVFRYYSCPHRPLPASLITRVKPAVPCHARPSLALRSRSARALPRVSSPARGPPTHVPTRSPGCPSPSGNTSES